MIQCQGEDWQFLESAKAALFTAYHHQGGDDDHHRQASSPHHQIGFGFVSDGAVFAKVKKSTNTETAMLSRSS